MPGSRFSTGLARAMGVKARMAEMIVVVSIVGKRIVGIDM